MVWNNGGIATGKNDERTPIPEEIALKLCTQIREENLNKRFNFLALQCRGCWKFSRGDPEKRCINASPGYRGCNLVNKCYDQMKDRL